MRQSTIPPTSANKYYLYDDATRIIYYCDEMPEDNNLIYIGTSNNPKPKMAAAAFMKKEKINHGYRVRQWHN